MYNNLKEDNNLRKAESLNNIGVVYRNLFDFNKAIEYHKESLDNLKGIDDCDE